MLICPTQQFIGYNGSLPGPLNVTNLQPPPVSFSEQWIPIHTGLPLVHHSTLPLHPARPVMTSYGKFGTMSSKNLSRRRKNSDSENLWPVRYPLVAGGNQILPSIPFRVIQPMQLGNQGEKQRMRRNPEIPSSSSSSSLSSLRMSTSSSSSASSRYSLSSSSSSRSSPSCSPNGVQKKLTDFSIDALLRSKNPNSDKPLDLAFKSYFGKIIASSIKVERNLLVGNAQPEKSSIQITSFSKQYLPIADVGGESSYDCPHCGRTYTTAGALKMHVRTHTLPCRCDICGKSFSRPWLLQGHMRTHSGEKPFKCSECGRAFADKSNLRAHLQTHSQIKRYKCSNCDRSFSRLPLLTKHRFHCAVC